MAAAWCSAIMVSTGNTFKYKPSVTLYPTIIGNRSEPPLRIHFIISYSFGLYVVNVLFYRLFLMRYSSEYRLHAARNPRVLGTNYLFLHNYTRNFCKKLSRFRGRNVNFTPKSSSTEQRKQTFGRIHAVFKKEKEFNQKQKLKKEMKNRRQHDFDFYIYLSFV